MEKCYEYFNCTQKNCKAHTQDAVCWEIEGTLCNSEHMAGFESSLKKISNDLSKCNLCAYKKQIKEPDSLYRSETSYY